MRILCLTLTLLFGCMTITTTTQAQLKKKIKKSRRNKAEHQQSIDKHDLEFDWELGNEVMNDSLMTYVYPNLAVRYGISNRIEVNIEANPLTTVLKQYQGKKTVSGMEPVFFGCRYELMQETKTAPEIGISLQVAPPFAATKNYSAKYWAPFLQMTIQKSVSERFTLSSSMGMFYDGFSTTPLFLYDLSAFFDISSIWTVGADAFGFISNTSQPQNNFDLNITYQPSQRWSLGAVAGTGINQAAHKAYMGINGTFGFSCSHKKTS